MALVTISLLLQLFGILVAIIGAAYVYIKHVKYNYWKSQGIDHPECIIPFGNLWPVLSTKKSIGELVADSYAQFKKNGVFGMYAITTPSLVICDPDLIKFVLTKEFSHFHDRGIYYNEKVDPLSANLFNVTGSKWRHLRPKFTPTFTSGKIKNTFPIVRETSDNLARYLAEEIKKNNLVEVRDVLARFTTDIITSIAFGIKCNSIQNPNEEFRSWSRLLFVPRPIFNALMIFYPPLLHLFKARQTDKGVSDFFIKAFTETVEYRTANNVVRKDFLHFLMELINKGYLKDDEGEDNSDISESATPGKITMLEGAAQAFTFWVGGFETSSTTATHALYELALNQQVQDKLADEVNTVLNEHGGLTYESLNAMPYLTKVVSETLRKYPVLPVLNRECNRDTDLPDTKITVKNGTAVMIPVLGIHMDPEIYPEPDKFDPERFSEENINGRHSYTYLPFGEGPRICIGMRFGLLQTKVALISLISKFSIHLGPDTKVPFPVDKGNFMYGPLGGMTLRIEKRRS